MQLKTDLILIGIILALIISMSVLFQINRNNRRELIRWKTNYSELDKKYSGDLSYIKLTVDEFKESSNKKIDSILIAAKIKPKQLNNFTTIINNYSDTSDVKVPVEEISDSLYEFADTLTCMKISGLVDVSKDIPVVTITDRRYDNNIYYMQYTERNKYRFLGLWKWRLFGKKESKIQIFSECGVVNANRIDIVK